MKKTLLLTALVGMGLAQASHAALTWNFVASSGDAGDQGVPSKSYTDTTSTYSLTAHGYDPGTPAADHNLYQKWTSSISNNETGLGLTGTSDHEVQIGQFIQLYFDPTTFAKNQFDDLTIYIGSVQSGEGWAIYGSSSAGEIGTEITSATGSGPLIANYTISGSDWQNYTYFSLVGKTSGDVLLMNGVTLEATAVPEPSTIIAGSLVLIPLVAQLRRKKQVV